MLLLVRECHILIGPLHLLSYWVNCSKISNIFFFLQKPRVCILGGGFGGLYTALRLESLVWPDDKKPQVSCD